MMLEPKVLAADAASLERRLIAEVKAGYDELAAYVKAHLSTETA